MKRWRGIARAAALIALATFFAFPLYWTVTMAFKPQAEWNPVGRVVWWPEHPTLDNFKQIAGHAEPSDSPFLSSPRHSAVRPIVNSAIAAGGGTVVALIVGVLIAYGVSRFRAGRRWFPFLLLQVRMFPLLVLVIPISLVASSVGLHGRLTGLALVYAALSVPLVVWLVRSALLDVPPEITDAAIVDGCTYWGAFLKAVLPQIRGAIAAAAVVAFILNWTDFTVALVLTDDHSRTAPVFLASMQNDEFARQFGPQAALALVLMVPVAAFGLLAQRFMLTGLTFGAVRSRRSTRSERRARQ